MSLSLGIVIDERLSRERALWITQVVKKLRTWTHVEFIKSDSFPEAWVEFLATHPQAKLLVPTHRVRDTLRLDDPNRFGFYASEPITPTQWSAALSAGPERLLEQTSLWNWNTSDKRLGALLLEMRAWLWCEQSGGLDTLDTHAKESARVLRGTIGALIDQLSSSSDPAAARRLLLTLQELQPHSSGPMHIEWLENASVRAVRMTVTAHSQRLPQLFATIARSSRIAQEAHFARALWSKQDDILEITLAQYPWDAPFSYWWGLAPAGAITPIPSTPAQSAEPKLTEATLRPDAALARENDRLRAMIEELKSGGVGQSSEQAKAPPETRELLEAFKQRYFESKLEVRKLEAALSSPVPDIRIVAMKKRIEELKAQHQDWIKILTETLAAEKKRRSS